MVFKFECQGIRIAYGSEWYWDAMNVKRGKSISKESC